MSVAEMGPTVQPLTRADCDSAGMQWNDNANVCGSETQIAAASPLLITIDKDTQRMTVSLDGIERHVWPVSTGQPGYSTPSGTYTASSMNKMWYSRQWDNAPMPHAVFFTREGHAIHGTTEVKRLGQSRLAWLRAPLPAKCRNALRAGRGGRLGQHPNRTRRPDAGRRGQVGELGAFEVQLSRGGFRAAPEAGSPV